MVFFTERMQNNAEARRIWNGAIGIHDRRVDRIMEVLASRFNSNEFARRDLFLVDLERGGELRHFITSGHLLEKYTNFVVGRSQYTLKLGINGVSMSQDFSSLKVPVPIIHDGKINDVKSAYLDLEMFMVIDPWSSDDSSARMPRFSGQLRLGKYGDWEVGATQVSKLVTLKAASSLFKDDKNSTYSDAEIIEMAKDISHGDVENVILNVEHILDIND